MNIQEEIREVAVSKNVNFLIGSGCSSGAIGTMNTYWEQAWKGKPKKMPEEIRLIHLVARKVNIAMIVNKRGMIFS